VGENKGEVIIDCETTSAQNGFEYTGVGDFTGIFTLKDVTIDNVGPSGVGVEILNAASNGSFLMDNCVINSGGGVNSGRAIVITYLNLCKLSNSSVNDFLDYWAVDLHDVIRNEVYGNSFDNCGISFYSINDHVTGMAFLNNNVVTNGISGGIQANASYIKAIGNVVTLIGSSGGAGNTECMLLENLSEGGIVSLNKLIITDLERIGPVFGLTITGGSDTEISNNEIIVESSFTNADALTFLAGIMPQGPQRNVINNNRIFAMVNRPTYNNYGYGIALRNGADYNKVQSNRIRLTNIATYDIGVKIIGTNCDYNWIDGNYTQDAGTRYSSDGGSGNVEGTYFEI